MRQQMDVVKSKAKVQTGVKARFDDVAGAGHFVSEPSDGAAGHTQDDGHCQGDDQRGATKFPGLHVLFLP